MNTTILRLLAAALCVAPACAREQIDHGGDTDEAASEDEFAARMAEAYCGALFACDPVATCHLGAPNYTSEADCIDGERTALERAQASAHAGGLEYDAACVESTIARYTAMGCQSHVQIQRADRSLFTTCPPYHGTLPEGEDTCTEVVGSALSNCGAGLRCSEGVCAADVDDTCQCEEGYACAPGEGEGDHPCIAVVGTGDVCLTAQGKTTAVCDPAGYCAASYDEDGTLLGGTCVQRKAMGEACQSPEECPSLRCDDVCVAPSPYLCEEHVAPRGWAD